MSLQSVVGHRIDWYLISPFQLCVFPAFDHIWPSKREEQWKTKRYPYPQSKGVWNCHIILRILNNNHSQTIHVLYGIFPYIYHKHQPFIYVCKYTIPYNPMGGHRPSRISLGSGGFLRNMVRSPTIGSWCCQGTRCPGSHRRRLIPPKTLRPKKKRAYWLVDVGCWWFGIRLGITLDSLFFDMFFFWGGGLYISSTRIFLWPTTMNHDEWMEWDEILVASVYPFVGYVFFERLFTWPSVVLHPHANRWLGKVTRKRTGGRFC